MPSDEQIERAAKAIRESEEGSALLDVVEAWMKRCGFDQVSEVNRDTSLQGMARAALAAVDAAPDLTTAYMLGHSRGKDATPDAGLTGIDAVREIMALRDEFGLRFQLADPDAKVSVEQRTINNLFFALLDARNATVQAKATQEGTTMPSDEQIERAAKAIAEMYPPRESKNDGYIKPVWDMADIEDLAEHALEAADAAPDLDALLDSVGGEIIEGPYLHYKDYCVGVEAHSGEAFEGKGRTRMAAIADAVAKAKAKEAGNG